MRAPTAVVAQRQAVRFYVPGDAGATDEGDRQPRRLPAAADEAADRSGAEHDDARALGQSTAPAIGGDALVREPQPLGRRPRLPEDIDRHAAARIPIAADAQPLRLH